MLEQQFDEHCSSVARDTLYDMSYASFSSEQGGPGHNSESMPVVSPPAKWLPYILSLQAPQLEA